jgi:hypothetical protein
LPDPVRVCAGPIPGDHADAGMGLSPAGDGLGLTSGPESERSPPVEVDPHGPRGRALAIGPILHAEPVGGATAGRGRRRSRCRSVWRLTARPKAQRNRAPALPARAKAIGTSPCASRCVRRAQGATSGASRAVNIRRVQRPFAQKHCRTRRSRTTCHGPPGRSATVRTSRLWRRRLGNRQTGQWTRACVDVTRHVRCVVGSSMCQASRGSRETSGSQRVNSVTAHHRLHGAIKQLRFSINIRVGWLWRKSSPKVRKSRMA